MEIDVDEQRSFGPANSCIYCGCAECIRTDEHILPAGLGGGHIYLKASCVECQKVINETVEQVVLRKFMRIVRYKENIGSRRLDSRPSVIPITLMNVDDSGKLDRTTMTTEEIELANHPAFFVLPYYQLPGLIRGKNPDESPESHLQSMLFYIDKTSPPESDKIVDSPKGRGYWLEQPFHHGIFMRFLAKIAHGFAVAQLGSKLQPYLPGFILGKNIGMAAYLVGSELKMHDEVSKYNVTMRVGRLPGQSRTYAIMSIALIGWRTAPIYTVCAGHLID